jgi:hypothetical protein
MTRSVIEKQIRRWTITVNCAGILAAIGVGVALYLENYFASNPTAEDLYYGTDGRGNTLWAIALPAIGVLVGYVFSGLFRIQNLRKQSLHQSQAPSTARQVRPPRQPRSPDVSKTDELTKLAKLRAEGVISEAEFASLKKEIIG